MSTTEQSGAIYSSFGDDEDFAEIVEMFVDEMPVRIETLLTQIETSCREDLQRTAHQMKGAAGSYGFDQLTPVAAELEAAIREQQSEPEIRAALDALVDMCRRVRSGAPQ